MVRLILLTIFLSSLSVSLFSQSRVKGYVYEDLNQNGKKDRKEKGIPGVGVSNGREVTVTNGNGIYELPIGNDNIIFVIKPSNYSLKINSANLPVSYYTHKPLGSPPSMKYKGVEPTGKLPASVDFGLLPEKVGTNFTTLIFGDPQVYTEQEVDFFKRGIVSEVAGIKNVPFGLSLGDLVGDTLDLQRSYIDVMRQIGIPWYNVMGNHDMNYDATNDSLADETFEANFGPANYSFNYGKAHFIMLDNILYPNPDNPTSGYTGGWRRDQLDFVENDLKLVDKESLVIISFHIPLKGNGVRRSDRKRLFDLLKDFPNTLTLSAHTHMQMNDFFGKEDGFMREKPHHEYNAGTTCGDWYNGELDEKGIPVSTMRDGTPKGYAFLNIKGNEYTIDYKVAGKPAEYQIEIFCPKVIPFERWTTSTVYANFFMGRKSDKVQYRFDDRNWKDMDFQDEADPSFLALLQPWDMTKQLLPGRRPSNASKSTHLWMGRFPWRGEYLSLGNHTVEVRATDMYGRTFTASRTFLVQETVVIPSETSPTTFMHPN